MRVELLWCRPKRPSNAHFLDREVNRIRVTHPFHPLHGRELEVVDHRHFQDGEYFYVDVGNGQVTRLPEAWTSLGAQDPFVTISAGRSLFLIKDLKRLSRLVGEILREQKTPVSHGGRDGV